MDAAARFSELVALPESDVDLSRAALAVAAGGDPDLDPDVWLAELDHLAAGVRDQGSLRGRLFDEVGLMGATGDYYDPDNSFLHRVLERRRGVPIALSVLTMEVGRRAGVELEGIGMPGHFLVRDRGTGLILDPHAGGEVLDLTACEARFRLHTGAGAEVPFGPHLLPVVGPHDILERMLGNLRAIYRTRGDAVSLEWVIRMRLALPGVPPEEVVELGQALGRQGRYLEGAGVIEVQALRHPEVSVGLRRAARTLRSRLN